MYSIVVTLIVQCGIIVSTVPDLQTVAWFCSLRKSEKKRACDQYSVTGQDVDKRNSPQGVQESVAASVSAYRSLALRLVLRTWYLLGT